MQTINSKYNLVRFYLGPALMFVLSGSLSVMLAFYSAHFLKKLSLVDMTGGTLIFFAGLTLFMFAIFIPVKYLKNAPRIHLDKETIRFGNREAFQLGNIREIRLTGKVPFSFLVNTPVEGSRIRFTDGTEKFIYDDFYYNAWQLKQFLFERTADKFSQTDNLSADNKSDEGFKFFKRFPLLSISGVLQYGVLLFSGFILAGTSISFSEGMIFMSVATLVFLIYGLHMYYPGVSGKYLLIKNQTYFFFRKKYALSDIREVTFEQPGRSTVNLRIITSDFKSRLYPCATLSHHSWYALEEELEKRNIPVRNECV